MKYEFDNYLRSVCTEDRHAIARRDKMLTYPVHVALRKCENPEQ
jgi:hypothetical protein